VVSFYSLNFHDIFDSNNRLAHILTSFSLRNLVRNVGKEIIQIPNDNRNQNMTTDYFYFLTEFQSYAQNLFSTTDFTDYTDFDLRNLWLQPLINLPS